MANAKGWTKTDLVARIMSNAGVSKAEAERQITNVLGSIEEGVQETGAVTLIGHGTYEKRQRSARKGRNPQTGAELQIEASTNCGFKSAKAFNEKLA